MTSPHYDKAILDLGIPVLGICYGCQLISWMSGGKVESCKKSEYGKIEITAPQRASFSRTFLIRISYG